MARPIDTIKLAAAQKIFDGCNIQVIRLGGQVAGYRAAINGHQVEHKYLTALIQERWRIAMGTTNETTN